MNVLRRHMLEKTEGMMRLDTWEGIDWSSNPFYNQEKLK